MLRLPHHRSRCRLSICGWELPSALEYCDDQTVSVDQLIFASMSAEAGTRGNGSIQAKVRSLLAVSLPMRTDTKVVARELGSMPRLTLLHFLDSTTKITTIAIVRLRIFSSKSVISVLPYASILILSSIWTPRILYIRHMPTISTIPLERLTLADIPSLPRLVLLQRPNYSNYIPRQLRSAVRRHNLHGF